MTKFLFDRIIALIGIIVLLPVYLILFVSIMVEKRTFKPIFRQKRVGWKGKCFYICKFKTIVTKDAKYTISVAGDERISPFCHILRKFKLDELPGLWNVLIGDMSFVGPRPDVPGYADKLEGEDRLILNLRPGITGPASIKYAQEEYILATVENPQKYNDEVIYPDKVKINLDYYYNRTFFGDIRIILRTIFRSYRTNN